MSLQAPNGTDRQESTSSMAALATRDKLAQETQATDVEKGSEVHTFVPNTTAISIREEFRCRRSWFFYHDIRAFVTSWLPLPLYLLWRIFLAIYITGWLIAHIVIRHDEFGPRWLIFITDLAFLLLTIGLCAMAILCIWYTVIHYGYPRKVVRYLPELKDTPQDFYSQDKIPWFVKLCWFLYMLGSSLVPLVVSGYWILVYEGCPSDSPLVNMTTTSIPVTTTPVTTVSPTTMAATTMNVTATTSLPPETPALVAISCSDIDAASLHFHGINFVLVLLDLALNRIPYQFMHFYVPEFFMIPYVIFTAIYWGAGGLNPNDNMQYIYASLDYTNASAVGWAILLLIAPMPIYLIIFFLLGWLRDFITKYVWCYYRDVTFVTENGIEVEIEVEVEPETTKL